MAAYTEEDVNFLGESIFSAPVTTSASRDTIAEALSGIILNQNSERNNAVSLENTNYVWQTFRFPGDYPRGVTGDEGLVVPKLCGFQVNVSVETGFRSTAGLDWIIDYWHPKNGWVGIAQGSEVGAPSEGDSVWFNVNFKPIDITNFWWRKFRLGVSGRTGDPSKYRVQLPYDQDNRTVVIDNQVINVVPNISPAPLVDGEYYAFQLDGGEPAIIEVMGEDVYYSEQQGIQGVNYTIPNPFTDNISIEYVSVNARAYDAANEEFEHIAESIPFATQITSEDDEIITIPRTVGSDIKAYQSDGVNPIIDTGQEASLCFRIMSTAPDQDQDCTGSLYRTIALVSNPEDVRGNVGDLQDSYWLSAPNPSQFACEALYLDIRDDGEPQVVDHITIDPITPGIYMNIYYSNDPIPGDTINAWDGLLWTRIDKQFFLRRKESFALPEPIAAKYIKLEFTHLQPMWYAPGSFQLPTQYRKHPKWVMDYYLSLYQQIRSLDLEQASTIDVTYDALDLAYNYYLDDIRQDRPLAPSTIESAEGVSLLSNVLTKEQNIEGNQVDANTLIQINLSMQPFLSQPSQQGGFGSLLQRIVGSTTQLNNYPVENTVKVTSATDQVSSLDRDSLIIEKQFPVTSFYLTCRHYYMVSQAIFKEDRAYFAGIKEVTLTREHYASRYDNDLYIETAGDNLNIESNDLDSVDLTWVTYKTS